MTTTEDAMLGPTAKAIVAILMSPTDSSDVVQQQAVATVAFSTSPTDAVEPDTTFRNVIVRAPTLEYNLTAAGQVTGESQVGQSSFIVQATDATMAANWRAYNWNGREIVVYVGAPQGADGATLSLEDFDVMWTGQIDRVDAAGGMTFEVTFAGARIALDRPISERKYRGLGGSFMFQESLLEAAHASSHEIDGAITIEAFGRWTEGPAKKMLLLQSGDDGAVNYSLHLNNIDNALAFGSGAQIVTSTWTPVLYGEPFYVAATVDADGVTLKMYAGRDDTDVELVHSATLSTPVTSGTAATMKMGAGGGIAYVQHDLFKVRLWDKTHTEDEIIALAGQSIDNAGDHPNLVEQWRFEERVKLLETDFVVFGEKGLIDFEITVGDPAWGSSYDGDPADFVEGSVAGLSIPRTYGYALNVPLVPIDSNLWAFAWDDAWGQDPTARGPRPWVIRSKGVPMVPPVVLETTGPMEWIFEVISPSGGGLQSLRSTGKVTYNDVGIGSTLARLIRGQRDPFRLGQEIEFSGTAANNKRWRLSQQASNTDFDNEIFMTGPAVTAGTDSGTLTSVGAQYEEFGGGPNQDLYFAGIGGPAMVQLTTAPVGDITGDVVGRYPDDGLNGWSFSNLFELIVGEAPNTDALTFDPLLGFHIPAGSDMTIKQVLDGMARSAWAWWIELPGGGYAIGTWAAPEGSPVTTITTSNAANIEELPSVDPSWKFNVGYDHNWSIQTGDGLAGSVTREDVLKWGQPYTKLPFFDRTVLGPYPTATPHEDFDTWLTRREDARDFGDLASPFVMAKRRWFRISLPSLWGLSIQLNDEIEVTWDDPALNIPDGTSMRVTGRAIDLDSGSMTLEAFF